MRIYGDSKMTAEEMVVVKYLKEDEIFSKLKLSGTECNVIARFIGRKFNILKCLKDENLKDKPFEFICEYLTNKEQYTFDYGLNSFTKVENSEEETCNEFPGNPCGEIIIGEPLPVTLEKFSI